MDVELLFRAIFTILWLVFIANLTAVRLSNYDLWKTAASRFFATLRGVEGKPAKAPAARSSGTGTVLQMERFHIVALALFAPFWFGGVILYIFLPGWIAVLSFSLPDWLRFVMAGVAAISIPFTLWGYRALGRNWAHALEPSAFLLKKHDELVTGGPYRYVRNPIYLGCFVFIIALALVAANWLLILPALVIIPIIYAQIPHEELMLAERFGKEYREYMKRTPQLIPKLWHGAP